MAPAPEIILSPRPAPAAPEGRPPDGPAAGRAMWITIVFISLFAALLASFPARNSDLWPHLAA
ncbi:MAG TPA: hypothetical protein VFE78_11870, partial [Gemmataceae bacterium]|nr:hypothetical protein [Gemmataceae bacterium]